MTIANGYVSSRSVVTVAELRAVLDSAADTDTVEIVTCIDSGETKPLKAAMAGDDEASRALGVVYLYVQHPGD